VFGDGFSQLPSGGALNPEDMEVILTRLQKLAEDNEGLRASVARLEERLASAEQVVPEVISLARSVKEAVDRLSGSYLYHLQRSYPDLQNAQGLSAMTRWVVSTGIPWFQSLFR